MQDAYTGVVTRFLRENERLLSSAEKEMPLVIESKDSTACSFLQQFLSTHSTNILKDLAKYGAVLLRGFAVNSEEDFEKTVLSIKGLRGISDAFMSEEGRIHVGDLKFVLHTNAVYKTGGTLYLGGFHSENYYSADVPSYICFCCLKPSTFGGETGLVNMGSIYQHLDPFLKKKLAENTFFVSKWLISEVADRYGISSQVVEKIAKHFGLPVIGEGNDKLILMYKPSIFKDPNTKKSSMQINLFEIASLNKQMRKYFINDYQGKAWFWHRLVWRLPTSVFSVLEFLYIIFASFFYSPKNSLTILRSKLSTYRASRKKAFSELRVGSCFTDQEIKLLAKLIRNHYSSCLWKKGDILLVDNKQVMHAGMPGAGARLVRAMICNPLTMSYSPEKPGTIECQERETESVGFYMAAGQLPPEDLSTQ